ncbi:organelle RRM domain-containing protein 6, chloroplastic-like isoform X2 [Phoenix dactylifera]|uniref:Organelle RRM domain-containing protein 6, chloroplastic isoform X2 n=1 Tax=Phoenix dactylifera TaxID=42345 RepID=A0A8B7C9L7_PHODC|nr:organelle RRM domain-containing protein 6, chloroplastic isoform X2 [Phoenix dactylifera]XP_038977873.1 organelle RRM domain-containing protein 6, chloroplastic-like isoform X2 [Phoenix dactylifera]
MATMAISVLPSVASLVSSPSLKRRGAVEISSSFIFRCPSLQSPPLSLSWSQSAVNARRGSGFLVACLPPAPKSASRASTRLYVSGLSFHTTKESLRNAFQNFGQLVEVTLVMDRIANRPRGFAFLRYATEEESRKAIEGMHGKGLHVLFS